LREGEKKSVSLSSTFVFFMLFNEPIFLNGFLAWCRRAFDFNNLTLIVL
jgi:hypothetical protein